MCWTCLPFFGGKQKAIRGQDVLKMEQFLHVFFEINDDVSGDMVFFYFTC